MKSLVGLALLLVAAASASAQVSSHAPTGATKAATPPTSALQIGDRPVARVNGAVLTDRDLLREMMQIFPYAGQHGGFPKEQEASIRQGALQMIIFEELVFQDAVRRKLTVAPLEIKKAETEFKKQFGSPEEYRQYLKVEMGGSEQAVREKVTRSLLIEQVLKSDVQNRSAMTLADVRVYYDKNPARFQVPESYTFQSISILPPQHPSEAQKAEGLKRASEAWKQAQTTKTAEEFGVLAEKISEDDFRVNMGEHKTVEKDQLPPQVVKAFATMNAGQVSGLIQIEQAYTIIRLNAHTTAGKKSFAEVQGELRTELQKNKYEKLRAGLDKRLRANAKVEVL
jgi:peptidyl-prolyl cis-trans isomerase SurA